MTSRETKRQEMTSGDVPVCRIPLLICFESTGHKKRGGIAHCLEPYNRREYLIIIKALYS